MKPFGEPVQIGTTGVWKNTSKNTAGTITCTFVGGRFTKKETNFKDEVGGDFTTLAWAAGQDRKMPANNQKCADVEAGDALEGARCYADALHGGGGGGDDTKCIRRIDFNWGAKSAEEFVGGKGPVKAQNMYLFEKFRYDSATSGSFREESEYFQSLDLGNNNGWTDCRVIENMTFAIKSIPGSKDLFVEMQSSSRSADPKPACIAAYKDDKDVNNGFKTLFKMIPQ
jgi:hypothetical protein